MKQPLLRIQDPDIDTRDLEGNDDEKKGYIPKKWKNHPFFQLAQHIWQSVEDPVSKFLGASVSLSMTFKNGIVGFIPLLTVYPTFKVNYELYTKRASSQIGSEILPRQNEPPQEQSRAQNFKTQVGYALLWLASAQGGFTYGWGMVLVMAPNSSYFIKALVGYSTAMLQHSYHMGNEIELTYEIIRCNGAPAYREGVGKCLDFSRSLLLIPPAVSSWLHKKTNLNHFGIRMAPLYRSGVHIAAIFTALTKVFHVPSLLAYPIAALFGPFEADYIAAYNQRVAKVLLDLNDTKPEGVSRVLLALFDNPVSRLFFNVLTLTPLTRLLAVFIDPLWLCKISKITGSGAMGTGSAAEIREKLPELVLIFSQLFGNPIEFSIPDEVSLNANEEPGKFLYLSMLALMTGILLLTGRTQFFSARKSTLGGVKIGFDEQIREHYYGGQTPKATHCERVQQRSRVAFKDMMDSLTLTLWSQKNRCEYVKENFGLWSSPQPNNTFQLQESQEVVNSL